MVTKKCLISKLRSPDNKVALIAVGKLRANGWLEDGSLARMNLQFAHLQGIDFTKADLNKVNLANSDLRGAILYKADLSGAVFTKANLLRADLSRANVRGARFVGANFQDVFGLTDEQLLEADALLNATMPDGRIYDGRFNLPGDIHIARMRGVNLSDPRERDTFYSAIGSPPGDENLPQFHKSFSDQQLFKKLYSSDNKTVRAVVDELRNRGRLTDGSLEWMHLKFVQMQKTNLSAARLSKADLYKAQLTWADLTSAVLKKARLVKANLEHAILSHADLQGANLVKANLYCAEGITEEQLCSLSGLRGAKMPDGKQYDGRYKLSGDIWDADYLHFDINDPKSMADFYGITPEDFMLGQQWAKTYLGGFWIEAEHLHDRIDIETIIDTLIELYE